MDRRHALTGIGSLALVGLADCSRIRGAILGTTPKKFEIRNDASSSTPVDVQIEADNEIVVDESYQMPENKTVDKP